MYFFARKRYSSYEGNIGELEAENIRINNEYKKVEKNLQELDASTKINIKELNNEKQKLVSYVKKYDDAIKELKKDIKNK